MNFSIVPFRSEAMFDGWNVRISFCEIMFDSWTFDVDVDGLVLTSQLVVVDKFDNLPIGCRRFFRAPLQTEDDGEVRFWANDPDRKVWALQKIPDNARSVMFEKWQKSDIRCLRDPLQNERVKVLGKKFKFYGHCPKKVDRFVKINNTCKMV